MELTPKAFEGSAKAAAAAKEQADKEKQRVKQSSSSSSEKSDSSQQMQILDRKIILRTLELDKMTIDDLRKRMAQYESEASAKRNNAMVSADGKQHAIEPVVPISADEKKEKHRSVVYISPLKIPKVNSDPNRDIEKGEKVTMTDADYEAMVDHYAKETGKDLSLIKKRLASKFKELNEAPADSPKYDPNAVHALATYRTAIQVQKESHTDIATARKASPVNPAISRSADQSIQPRGPTIKEVIEHELGANASEVLESIATATIDALTKKVNDAQSTQNKTAGGGVVASVVTAGVTALVTYLGTKHTC